MSTAVLPIEIGLGEFIARPEREDGLREELIEGELVLSPTAKLKHGLIVDALREALRPLRGKGYVLMNDNSVVLRPKSMPTPDLFAVRKERARAALDTDDWLEGSPELVIEVISPSNRRLGRKADLYLQHGAQQVWLVNPRRRTVTAFSAEGDSPVEFRPGETDRLEFEGVLVDLAEVFNAHQLLL